MKKMMTLLKRLESLTRFWMMKRMIMVLGGIVTQLYLPESCDFNEQTTKIKSPNFSLNKQISDPCVQNLVSTAGLGKYLSGQLVVISLVGIKSGFYTRKRSWSGRGGWLSWRGSTPGARTLARGRRRITASLGTSVGKDGMRLAEVI